MAARKYFVIFSETRGGYWNRVTKKIRGLEFATEYEGSNILGIEQIIMNDSDILERVGCYSVKTIIKIEEDIVEEDIVEEEKKVKKKKKKKK